MTATPNESGVLVPIGTVDEWVAVLPSYQGNVLRELLSHSDPTEAAISWLTSTGPADTAPYGGVRVAAELFYDNLLAELQKLLCDDAGYEDERKQLSALAASGKMAVVSFVSITLAPHVGVAAVVIVPAVAIALALVGKAGKAATCETLAGYIDSRKDDSAGS